MSTLQEVFAKIERVADGNVDLDEWERTVYEYSHLISMKPVGSLMNDLTADVIAVGRLLHRGHRPGVQAGLFRISAGLSGLLATELGDVGDRRTARIAWRSARRAADASGDRDLSVWVRAKEADDARWAGSPVPVVSRLVDEAAEMASGSPSYGLFRAQTVQAWLAARRGDHAGARSVLRDFVWTFEHLPDGSTSPDAAFGLVASGSGEAFLRWHEAYVRTLIDDDQASRATEQALALYPATLSGPVALLNLMQAMRLVREREVGEGLSHALAALESGSMSAARRHLAGQILVGLPGDAHALPAAQELRAMVSV
ncbi:hypothetical protein HNP84_009336 [Thermocatellispora tengchongensis]|uniref:XRE family transcriptional regulator n=1 Tax=Thermocatellispora tengchongensis TaxID=1073253 RepID=A0A840PNF9_9ACTN|nr:XRE family transcriptional regulator [Thermocatellispora tengchongensis]MBB5139573.1 hypothetical protein [Thermocatellispora tengchongensis]